MTGNHNSGGRRQGAGRKQTLTDQESRDVAISCWGRLDALKEEHARRKADEIVSSLNTPGLQKFISDRTREERKFWAFATQYQREFGLADGTYSDREAKARKSLKSKLGNLVL